MKKIILSFTKTTWFSHQGAIHRTVKHQRQAPDHESWYPYYTCWNRKNRVHRNCIASEGSELNLSKCVCFCVPGSFSVIHKNATWNQTCKIAFSWGSIWGHFSGRENTEEKSSWVSRNWIVYIMAKAPLSLPGGACATILFIVIVPVPILVINTAPL